MLNTTETTGLATFLLHNIKENMNVMNVGVLQKVQLIETIH